MMRYARKPIAALFALTLLLSVASPALGYHEFDDAEHPFDKQVFEDRWARTDQPIKEDAVDRTWIWGPEPYTPGMIEPYSDSPGGFREVQYFDKSRMELNDPRADRDDLWSVTNGLLVVEMVEGRIQTGDNEFDASPDPADISIAGDLGDGNGPTYATINEFSLRELAGREPGMIINEHLTMTDIESADEYAEYGVTAAEYVEETHHTVASVFWDFMNEAGPVSVNGETVTNRLFPNPFYATGYPITEAFWSTVNLEGEPTDVLWQCFERRCLTYTPDNPEGWQVESGNVGQHYFQWRYGETGPATETVDLYLTATGDTGEQGPEFGCEDSLVPVQGEIQRHDELNLRAAAALQALFNAQHEDLYNVFDKGAGDPSVESVSVTEGVATVQLAGPLGIGGVCDEPRVEEQIRSTLTQFDDIDKVALFHEGDPLFPPQEQPTEGVVAVFQVQDQPFRVWVTNEETIDELYAVQAGESQATIPNGAIHRGPGEFNHNQPWSWHLDPEQIEMAEMTIEVCDGTPAFVEANVDYFVDDVGNYCPWSAKLVEIIDYRE